MKTLLPILQKLRQAAANRIVQSAFVLFGLGLIGVVILWARPSLQIWQLTETIKRENLPSDYLDRALESEKNGDDNQAYVFYQRAIDQAVRPADRARAGRLMGEFLLKRAHVQPTPFGAMARGYLESALAIERNAEELLIINKNLMEIARLLGETHVVAEVSDRAEALAHDSEEKAELLMTRFDALLAIGAWDETHQTLQKLSLLDVSPKQNLARMLRRAMYQERLLSDDEWFQGWLSEAGAKRKPVTARSDLLRDTLGLYAKLAEDSPEFVEECLFRAARLCSAENHFEEARDLIRSFFERNCHAHEEDIILLLIRMARLEGNTRQTQTLISQLLQRYQWMDKAADELLAVVEQAESAGHLAEAFEILNEFLKVTPEREGLARLAYKAGDMASRLKFYDRAMDLLGQAEQARPDDDLHVSILMAKAGICLQRKEYVEAQRWLTMALTRFPYDPRRGKALYQLVDIFRKSQAPLANILLVMSMAVDVAPNDPSALEVLMQLANRYEELGLYTRAEEKYAKVALLRAVDSKTRGRSEDSTAVSEALLGSARCLARVGNTVRADRILRGLTRNLSSGPLFNEAVYLWATLAVAEDQRVEAMRRLDMMDLAHCPRDIKSRSQLERLILEVAEQGREPESVVAFIASVKNLPENELQAYARRAYLACFGRFAREKNIPAMQQLLDRVAGSISGLPDAAWVMRLALTVLNEHGVPAFKTCLDRNLANLSKATPAQKEDVKNLIVMADSIESVRTRVDAFVR